MGAAAEEGWDKREAARPGGRGAPVPRAQWADTAGDVVLAREGGAEGVPPPGAGAGTGAGRASLGGLASSPASREAGSVAMSFSPPRSSPGEYPARGAGGGRSRPCIRVPTSPSQRSVSRRARPTLRLEQFQAVPVLDFGCSMAVGEAKALDLEVINPRGEPQELTVDRLAVCKGIIWEGPPLPLRVPPHKSVVVRLAWRPRRPGPFSESVLFKWGDRHRLQVRVLGEAAGDWSPPPPEDALRPVALRSRLSACTSAKRGSPAKRRGTISGGSAASTRGSRVAPQPKMLKLKRVGSASAAKTRSAAAVAASAGGGGASGLLGGPAPAGRRARGERRSGSVPGPSAPGSFAEYHASLSMARRETALQAWFNHRVGQAGGGGEASGQAVKGCPSVPPPTAGPGSPCPSLQARHAASKVSGLLWQLYSGKDPHMVESMLRVERLIDAGQLRLREDNSLLGDVRLQERAWRVLGSYHPWWLRLAFETITGYAARGDTLPDLELPGGLQRFFLDEFLACPAVSQRFARNAAVEGLHLPGYWEALGRAVLKRFLLLAMLLDRAAAQLQEQRGQHQVEADGLPPLFHPHAEHTSSEALVSAFLADNLRGEGDVLRHLRFHDYALRYRQPAFVEFDFRAQNPASDFRDGARLCWLADTLVPGSHLMAQAKVPAPAPAARAHNLGLALKALQPKCGRPEFEGAICADEILQGDRERTLELLWRAFAVWELPRLVPETDLRLEVSRLRSLAGSAVRSCTTATPTSCGIERLDLLLQWMRLVDALTSTEEEAGAPSSGSSKGLDAPPINFDSSLSDGRLLCQLVTFYAPGYLDRARIHSLTPGSAEVAQLLEGAAGNFDLLGAAARALGGIPEGCVAPPHDLETHGVDRRAGAILVAHLANRLLGTARGERAAMRIQRAWRSVSRASAPEAAPSPGEAERRLARRQEAERAALRRVELAERLAARKAAAAEQAAAERERAAERKAAALELRAGERADRAEREAFRKAEETERAAAERVEVAERRAAGKVREAERLAAEKTAAAERAEARATAAAEQAAERDAQAAEEAGQEAVEAARRRAAAAVESIAVGRRPAERAAVASRRAEEIEQASREKVAAAERMVQERARAAELAALEKAAAAERRAAAAEEEARRRAAEVERRAEEKILAAEENAARRAAAAEEAAFQRAAESERRAAAQAAEADRMAAEIEAESERMAEEMAAAAESVAAEKTARVEALKAEAQAAREAQAVWEAKAAQAAREAQAEAERAASLERGRRDEAATSLQAHARGMLVRRRIRAAAAARLWREREEDAAARAIQRAFAARMERKRFAVLRHAAVRVQARTRGNEARRSLQAMQLVATAIQAAVRGWIARRTLARTRAAALRIQVAWRGCAACRESSTSPLREGWRRRLVAEAGASMGPGSPAGQTLEAQARMAVERLLRAQRWEEKLSGSGSPNSSSAACEAAATLEFSTRYSRECCRLLARSPGALAGLLRLLRGCDARSEHGLGLQRAALGVLENVCRCGGLAARVREVPGSLEVLVEQLQLWRGLEAAFVPAARVLALMCRGSAGETGAGLDEADLRRVRSVSVLLAQKHRAESSCLAHLSSNLPAGAAGAGKGPGASRRGARLRALEAQLGALADVTDALEVPLRALRAAEVRGPGL